METRIFAMHKINKNSSHYAGVKSYMIENGAPVIKVCDNGNGLYALEGSHRIAAAHELGLMPEWDYVDADDIVEHDIDNDEIKTANDICGYSDCIVFDFEEIYYGE